ncbi:helix-turn-helix domain-containing protein [Aureimonas ureilytica]|uniref:helix-turn-helix domain-containing protein n=1 Tax=Aureimonas ureilytica TaxID=401562 RepID=UPI000361E070|nr:helix-turn-helix transcriptional regulator [Aureimonas ureilytica]
MATKGKDQEAEKERLRRECGAWLQKQRETVGLSQAEFAKLVKFELKTFVSQVETGKRRIPQEHYHDWARALRMDTREFVATLLSYYEPITYGIIFKDRRPHGIIGG